MKNTPLIERLESRIAPAFAANINLIDLDGTDGFSISGEVAFDQSGYSVSNAGDVNGDGFGDIIIGARYADPVGSSSGASYVVFGAAGGFAANLNLTALNGTNGFQISGVAGDDRSGFSVSSAGDVNGDNFDDLIIGAYGADPNGPNSGASYVVFGAASGFGANLNLSTLNGTNGFRISGAAADDLSGRSVSGAGDVNGDGFDDVIIGADQADPNGVGSGASYVVFGAATGFAANLDLSTLNGTNGFRVSGVMATDRSGRSVSGAGDVNGDTIDDLIIGAFLADPNGAAGAGASYVVFGRTSGFAANLDLSTLDGSNGFKLSGVAALDNSGRSVSGAGDVNGDGFDDIIIGANEADPLGGTSAGISYVVFGAASGFAANLNLSTLNGTNGFRINGVLTSDYSGFSVSGAGDVNGDGFDDVIIGAYLEDRSGDSSGSAYVVFGKPGGFAASFNLSSLTGLNGFKLSGGAEFDFAGRSVSGAGDINNDGFDDIVIGASGADSNTFNTSGATYVVFGMASSDPLPIIAIGDASIAEGNNGTTSLTFSVSLSAASTQTVMVTFATANGTATSPSDYTALASSTLTFAPGQTVRTITVDVLGETVFEDDETFFVNLSNPTNATLPDNRALGTILNDDAIPVVSIGDISVAEGRSGTSAATFNVTLSAASSRPITVQYATADGTAVSPGDYAAVALSTLTFAAGETTKSITVDVVGDTVVEGDETFVVNLSNPTNATLADAQATATILDSVELPAVSIGNVSVTEGDSGTTAATFVVSLSFASTQPVTVQYLTTNGTATTPQDYQAVPLTTLTFAPGETSKSISVNVEGDSVVEANENFFVSLSNPGNATIADAQGEGTIVNDDSGPQPTGVTIIKGGKAATYTDVDGDKVTVKTSKGLFTEALFDTREEGLGFQLESLNLTDPAFTQSKISFSAKGGNGMVNVGAIDAAGVDLKSVEFKGDLGQIEAGDGNLAKPALGSLSVTTFGALGLVTQAAGGDLLSTLAGSLKKLTVKGDMLAALEVNLGATGSAVGKVKIKGSLGTSTLAAGGTGNGNVPQVSSLIRTDADIGNVSISGNVIGVAGTSGIFSGGTIGKVEIGGDLRSPDPAVPVTISAVGTIGAANQKDATAIASVTVNGNVFNARILAGYSTGLAAVNADAAIGEVTVQGNFGASSLVAGVSDSTGDGFGRNDTLIAGGRADLIAKIAMVTIKGTASGSIFETTDHFGITAEEFGKVKIGPNKLNLDGNADLLLDSVNNDLRLVELPA